MHCVCKFTPFSIGTNLGGVPKNKVLSPKISTSYHSLRDRLNLKTGPNLLKKIRNWTFFNYWKRKKKKNIYYGLKDLLWIFFFYYKCRTQLLLENAVRNEMSLIFCVHVEVMEKQGFLLHIQQVCQLLWTW